MEWKRTIKVLWPSIERDAGSVLRLALKRKMSARVLNTVYDHLSPSQKHTFYARFCHEAHDDAQSAKIEWSVSFCDRKIVLPLGGASAAFRWEAALALLGHEPEIKLLYQDLIRTSSRPMTIFDIGANYGLHSILFLVHGHRAVSFEPNSECHEYFRELSGLNGVQCQLEPLALSDRAEQVKLTFPVNETWLGSVVDSVAEALSRDHTVHAVAVTATTIDQYVSDRGIVPDVVKIDTEGHEHAILKGARRLLQDASPLIVFESWPGTSRTELFDVLVEVGYGIYALELSERQRLQETTFTQSRATNFLAIKERSPFLQRLGLN